MKRSITLVAALGLGLTLAACGAKTDSGVAQPASGTSAASTSAAADSGEAIEWMDKFCGSLSPLMTLANIQMPDIKPGDVAGAHKALSDMFGKFVPPLDGAVQGLQALGPAPVKDGDAARQAFLASLTPVRDEIKTAQEKFDKSKSSDAQALLDAGQAFQKIGTEMSSLDPSKQLQNTPELDALAAKAPSCKPLGI